ncbi:ABC transporter permease, partial [Chloroflexota bacterium]
MTSMASSRMRLTRILYDEGEILKNKEPSRRTVRDGKFPPLVPMISICILTLLIIIAILAPIIAPWPSTEASLAKRLLPPFWMAGAQSEYLLGTDLFGRDIFSRLIWGARISLTVSAIAVFISGTIGSVVGMIAGYMGRWADAFLMRITDGALSIPMVLLALLLASIVGPSYGNVIIIIGLLLWPRYARQVRGETLAIMQQDFVALARVGGASARRILMRHVFPNLLPSLL